MATYTVTTTAHAITIETWRVEIPDDIVRDDEFGWLEVLADPEHFNATVEFVEEEIGSEHDREIVTVTGV